MPGSSTSRRYVRATQRKNGSVALPAAFTARRLIPSRTAAASRAGEEIGTASPNSDWSWAMKAALSSSWRVSGPGVAEITRHRDASAQKLEPAARVVGQLDLPRRRLGQDHAVRITAAVAVTLAHEPGLRAQ